MTKYIRHVSAPLVLAASFALAACSSADKGPDSSLARDTALNNDLALAGQDSTVQPALQDVPATPAAVPPMVAPGNAPAPRTTTAPARPTTTRRTTTTTTTTTPARPTTTASGNTVTRTTGSAAGGRVGTIASGTSLALRSNARVCTNTFTVGQTFTATTA